MRSPQIACTRRALRLRGPRRAAKGMLAWLFALCLAVPTAAMAQTQAYPDRPIRILLGFTPGGGGDILGRVIAQKLSERMKVAVPFENRAGANGVIAAAAVAKSRADGYTLLFITTSHALNAVSAQDLPYDSLNDLTGITQVASFPNVQVINSNVPAKSLAEFIALLKASPGKYNFASTGVGGATHLAGQAFLMAAGVNMTHVPYQGAGAAMTALRSGEVSAYFGSVVSVRPLIESGLFRALAITSDQRSASLPNVPTMREQGVDVELTSFYGILAPARTPDEVVKKLNENLVAVIKLPDIATRLATEGASPVGSSAEEFNRFFADQVKRLGPLVKAASEAQP